MSGLHLYNRISGLMKKIDLWGRKCQDGDVSSFPQLNVCILKGGADKVSILQTVQTHMSKLSSEFKSYFPDIEVQNSKIDWIRNPFAATSTQTASVNLQERLIDLSLDRGLKMLFSETPLIQFWCNVVKEYTRCWEMCSLWTAAFWINLFVWGHIFIHDTHKDKTEKQTQLGEKPYCCCCHTSPQNEKCYLWQTRANFTLKIKWIYLFSDGPLLNVNKLTFSAIQLKVKAYKYYCVMTIHFMLLKY